MAAEDDDIEELLKLDGAFLSKSWGDILMGSGERVVVAKVTVAPAGCGGSGSGAALSTAAAAAACA